mmetsp:Transcript_24781/g.58090  ORF Transcript_24781/g.58090 Transcript_24781/m.58090 type:complete len:119 (+) Transcript_24781:23-379(+)
MIGIPTYMLEYEVPHLDITHLLITGRITAFPNDRGFGFGSDCADFCSGSDPCGPCPSNETWTDRAGTSSSRADLGLYLCRDRGRDHPGPSDRAGPCPDAGAILSPGESRLRHPPPYSG